MAQIVHRSRRCIPSTVTMQRKKLPTFSKRQQPAHLPTVVLGHGSLCSAAGAAIFHLTDGSVVSASFRPIMSRIFCARTLPVQLHGFCQCRSSFSMEWLPSMARSSTATAPTLWSQSAPSCMSLESWWFPFPLNTISSSSLSLSAVALERPWYSTVLPMPFLLGSQAGEGWR